MLGRTSVHGAVILSLWLVTAGGETRADTRPGGHFDSQDCADGFGGPPQSAMPPIAGNWQLTFVDDQARIELTTDRSLDDLIKWHKGDVGQGLNANASSQQVQRQISGGPLAGRRNFQSADLFDAIRLGCDNHRAVTITHR